jgi:hypothetical protein
MIGDSRARMRKSCHLRQLAHAPRAAAGCSPR